ncbi:ATPase [Candidatus Wirthbacteria bacterium CG2_30_54_11]|uniref:ATPase n=1 Tax=Candidatus Wirthbacteria bacterium CG2_30_54_11 TaxID=1817892 RepID=A0A1J5IY98_9BACT|nr:MAG: ATPase [Candidatus Wirthbacteria bacterium CG2_30_54_11]
MALSEHEVKQLRGLSSEEVRQKLEQYGYNELPSGKKKTLLTIALGVVEEPMFLLLVACGTLYLFLGDLQEAIMLLGFVFVMIGITIYQEGKTENAIEALKDLSSPRALVIRDGERVRIAGREVVPGDYMIITEGDRIAADGVLLWGISVSADESLLTGESVAVRKNPTDTEPATLEMGRPGGDDLPFVYSGSMVVQGQGVVLIKNTGLQTEMGRIGKALQSVEQEETPLQKETGHLVKTIFMIAVGLCALVVIASLLATGNLVESFLTGVTLAMAMLPEEFPVVLTVFLALGAYRMSLKKMLARKMSAVETLGAATVLCVDKTGTLTQNLMTIQMLYVKDAFFDIDTAGDLPETFHRLIEYGILASKRYPFDPMDKALKQIGDLKLAQTEHLHQDWNLVQEYPLSRELLALSQVWSSPNGRDYVISAKGAPEAIMDLCHLPADRQKELADKIQQMAGRGLRVLGVARATFQHDASLPKKQHDFDFHFIGLIGLADPIRPTVPPAIKECYTAGIRVVMITGDYPKTAQNIAQQIGLRNTENIITGPELEQMDEATLRERVKHTDIFARVVPEQKFILVNALKANGEVVGMTGDGVNDAPALKSAAIGIAMGERGTDVAREASDLVLLDDDFSTIVAAVRMGRRIYDNLKKAMAYIVSVHIPIAGMALLPVLLRWEETILYPVHIVFLELIIDPACSVVFEAEEADDDIMQRRPRSIKAPLFSRKALFISLLQGTVSLIIVAAVYKISLYLGETFSEARTLSFITLIISNLCLILTNRSWAASIIANMKKQNKALGYVLSGALLFLGLVITVPFLQNMFHFAPMHLIDLFITVSAGVISVVWFELVKLYAIKRHQDLLTETIPLP